MNYMGQLLGIAAMIISFFIYVQTSRCKMVMLKLVTDFLWAAHHILIASYTAAATTGIAILRELLFLPKKERTRSLTVLAVFSVLFVAAAIFTWKDNFSVLPAIASVLLTLAFGNSKVKAIRGFAFLSSVCMLAYGIHYFSIPTIINEILVEGSVVISFIRENKKKSWRFQNESVG